MPQKVGANQQRQASDQFGPFWNVIPVGRDNEDYPEGYQYSTQRREEDENFVILFIETKVGNNLLLLLLADQAGSPDFLHIGEFHSRGYYP